jgi:hypothetical protein
MEHGRSRGTVWLVVVVLVHLLINIAHGAAHTGASVAISPLSRAFVLVVIIVAPLAGLALLRASARLGSWIVAVSLGGALVFGLINHFLITSADHVMHVVGPWRLLFGSTAVLLLITEALGSGLAVWNAVRARSGI